MIEGASSAARRFRGLRSRAAVAAAALALVSALLAGCTRVQTAHGTAASVARGGGSSPVGGAVAARRNPWTRPGTFTYAETEDPRSLNPLLAANSACGDLSMFLYSYAVRYDDRARPVPDALGRIPTVANGDVSRDGLTLKYRLRRDITWHDGVPLTSKDLRFTWRAVMNPHNNVVTTDGYKDIASIDDSDPHVAVIHMKRLYAPFLQQLWGVNGNAAILPEHLLAKFNDDRGSLNSAPYNSAPIGSGPFRFVSWQRGSQVELAAYDRYFRGRPKLDRVIFKIMPDENTEITQLRTHEIDMLARGSGFHWPLYQNIPGTVAIRPPAFVYSHIDFNLKRPLFADVRMRRALAHGVDRKEILEKIAHGLGDLSETDQSPRLSWAYTANVPHHDHDPQRARALLDAAGWHPGPDGIRVKNGQRLSFNLQTTTESAAGAATETLLQREWHDIGVDARIKNVPSSLMFENSAAGTLQGGNYDVALFSWSASADPDDSAIYSADNLAPHGQNALFWTDRRATAAMNDALKTVDTARRKADYAIVQWELASQVPTIILYFQQQPFVYNTDLTGFRPSPVISPFWNPWTYAL